MGPSRCGIVFSLNIGTIGTYYPSIASTLSALASMVIGFVKVRLNSTVAMKSLKPNNLLQKE